MKKFFASLVFLTMTAVLAAAEVAAIDNFRHENAPVLIPAVRKYRPAPGTVALPDTLTVAVPDGEELIVGQLADEIKRFGKTAEAAKIPRRQTGPSAPIKDFVLRRRPRCCAPPPAASCCGTCPAASRGGG